MADSNPFSPDAWVDAQRRYWDSWMDLTRQAGGAAGAAKGAADTPWAQSLEQWWRAVAPAAGESGAGREFYDHLLALGRGYFSMAEDLAKTATAGGGLDGWLEQVSAAFGGGKAGAGRHKDFMAFWDLPLDTWQRTVSSFSPIPGDYLHALHPEGAGDMHEHLDRFLSIPAVGYSRESQEQHQHFGRLVIEYQKALQDYAAAMSKLGGRSLERFREKLEEAEEPVTTVRGMYDLWVDACEDEYGAYTMTEEYAELYGALVNTLMAVKHQGAVMVDETLEGLNMPTRREVNTLHRRLQETRRELRALRDQIESRSKRPG